MLITFTDILKLLEFSKILHYFDCKTCDCDIKVAILIGFTTSYDIIIITTVVLSEELLPVFLNLRKTPVDDKTVVKWENMEIQPRNCLL